MDRNEQDPLGRSPLLHMELIIHTARDPERRTELAQLMTARRALIAQILRGTSLAKSRPSANKLERLCGMLLAMEDGFRLQRLIDPASTPADSFLHAVSDLREGFSLDHER